MRGAGAVLRVVVVVVAANVVGAAPSSSSSLMASPSSLMASSSSLWPSSFLQGMAPLVGVGPLPPSSSCGACHPDEYVQWQGSRHRAAATNDVFVDGLRQEPHRRCVNCHAPIPQGARDVERALASGPTTPLSLPPTSAAHEGISCAVCHVRDGIVVGAGSGRGYGHDVRVAAELKSPTFCAACHEFVGHEVKDGVTTLSALPMQSTFSEWMAWRDHSGDARTCQHCHMPEGRHDFDGTSVAVLRQSLDVAFDGDGDDVVVVVAAVDVGHLFPTGDVFRHLTLWADIAGQRRELFRFERRTALVDDHGRPTQVIATDTRLVPGEPRRVAVPADATTVVVTYHRADDRAEARGRVSHDDLVVEVLRRAVPR